MGSLPLQPTRDSAGAPPSGVRDEASAENGFWFILRSEPTW